MASTKLVIVRQPIDLGDGKCHPLSDTDSGGRMLRPGAFYWHAGRLYVGYGWLSTFHESEEPVWDPNPVPLGAVVETCRGYYHFSDMFVENAPYFRKYAELTVRHIHKTHDGPNGFLKKEVIQTTDIREKIVLPPDYHLEYQWGGGGGGWVQVLNRQWRDPKKVMPKIRRAPNLDAMRFSLEAKKLYEEYMKNHGCIHGLRPE